AGISAGNVINHLEIDAWRHIYSSRAPVFRTPHGFHAAAHPGDTCPTKLARVMRPAPPTRFFIETDPGGTGANQGFPPSDLVPDATVPNPPTLPSEDITMRLFTKTLLATAALAAMPMAANAESQFVSGTGNASAHLDFQVTVPRILFLQVGTGADGTTNPTIDQISFLVPAASLGNGTAVAATAASGDVGNGTVTAKVMGNNGTITFTSTTPGALG